MQERWENSTLSNNSTLYSFVYVFLIKYYSVLHKHMQERWENSTLSNNSALYSFVYVFLIKYYSVLHKHMQERWKKLAFNLKQQ